MWKNWFETNCTIDESAKGRAAFLLTVQVDNTTAKAFASGTVKRSRLKARAEVPKFLQCKRAILNHVFESGIIVTPWGWRRAVECDPREQIDLLIAVCTGPLCFLARSGRVSFG